MVKLVSAEDPNTTTYPKYLCLKSYAGQKCTHSHSGGVVCPCESTHTHTHAFTAGRCVLGWLELEKCIKIKTNIKSRDECDRVLRSVWCMRWPVATRIIKLTIHFCTQFSFDGECYVQLSAGDSFRGKSLQYCFHTWSRHCIWHIEKSFSIVYFSRKWLDEWGWERECDFSIELSFVKMESECAPAQRNQQCST